VTGNWTVDMLTASVATFDDSCRSCGCAGRKCVMHRWGLARLGASVAM